MQDKKVYIYKGNSFLSGKWGNWEIKADLRGFQGVKN